MRSTAYKIVVSLNVLASLVLAATYVGGATADAVKTQKESETKGYIAFRNHDEIVSMARKEGKLKVSTGLETPNFKPLVAGFKQKYPFMSDVQLEAIRGTDVYQRFLLEIQAGQAKEWDVIYIPIDFAKEYMPYLMKHDILNMAKQGVIKIHPGMIHPGERNMVSVTSTIRVVPYNAKLIADDNVPAKWEDFLKPEFKGRKFVLDIRPLGVAALVPAWGLERTLEFARKLAAQQPIWIRSGTRATTAIAAGEYPLYLGSGFHVASPAKDEDPTGNLRYKVIEPIPTRIVEDGIGILNTAEHPHAALLWLEFLASPEAQEIIHRYDPLKASVLTPGSANEQVTRGKKLSLVDWNHFAKFQEYTEKIFAAYGFPKAEQ